MKKVVHFQFKRETKGAVLFEEVKDGKPQSTNDPDCVIGSLYIRKRQLGNAIPATLTAEISF